MHSKLIRCHRSIVPNSSLFFKVGTVNIRTASEDAKLVHIVNEIERANLDICCLQEFRRIENGSIRIGNYDIYWTGTKRRKIHGVAIAVRNGKHVQVVDVENISSRVMSINVDVSGCKLKIVSAYGPTEVDTSESAKDLFWRQLRKTATTSDKKRQLMILGDMNSKTSLALSKTNFDGQDGLAHTSNSNGRRLIEFCTQTRCALLNSFFAHKTAQRITWHSNNHRDKNCIDYSLCNQFLKKYIRDTRVRNSYDFHSDHRLLVTTLALPISKRFRFIPNRPKCKSKKLNFTAATDKDRRMFLDKLQAYEGKDKPTEKSIDQLNDNIVSTLLSAAESTIPKQAKSSRKSNPWDSDEILQQLLLKRKNYMLVNRTEYRKTHREIRQRVSLLRNQYYADEANMINFAKENREIAAAFRRAKEQGSTIHARPPPVKCPGIREHFIKHFNPEHLKDLPTPDLIPESISIPVDLPNIVTSPPTTDEIVKVILKLKSNIATTDIPSELLKLATHSTKFLSDITKLMTEVWSSLQVPGDWASSSLTDIWKRKGSAKDPTTYRGISVSSNVAKICMNLILSRISAYYDTVLGENQMGFRPGRGTTDGGFVVKRFHQIARKQKAEIYTGYIDLSSAFDHVRRDWLFKIVKATISRDGLDPRLIDIIENLYQRTTAYMSGDEKDMRFKTTSGVRQGGTESPYLFNILMDFCMQKFEKCCKEKGISDIKIEFQIPSTATTRGQRRISRCRGTAGYRWVGYADDLVIMAKSQADLQAALQILDKIFKSYGLAINIGKTETMILNFQESADKAYPDSIASLHNKPLKNVHVFKYLGTMQHHNDPSIGDDEIENRIDCARSKFYSLKALFNNHKIHLQTRLLFLQSLVRSRLTYGVQYWTLTEKKIDLLESTWLKYLRHLIRGGFQKVRSSAGWLKHRIPSSQIYAITKSQTLREYIYKQQDRWVAHVCRQDNFRMTKRLAFESAKGKKRGIVNSTFSQVQRRYESLGMSKDTLFSKMITRQIPSKKE